MGKKGLKRYLGVEGSGGHSGKQVIAQESISLLECVHINNNKKCKNFKKLKGREIF